MMRECSSKSIKPLVESDADLELNSYSLQKFNVYETQARFYLVGRDKSRTRWRVLKIDRSEPTMLNIYEDPAIYTRQDCNGLLTRLAEGNRGCGGMNFVTKAYGIVGFIKFLEPYYMILVTKRRLVGNICGHAIYGIGESRLLTVPHPSVLTNLTVSNAERRYKRLFSSIDLTKDFFYSYTYRLMWTLQKNMTVGEAKRMPYNDMFVWNTFLTYEIRSQVRSLHWTVALIHGFFRQIRLACGDAKFTLTLVARRSRHFAGTRYLKRGVNAKGRVANDVETEQLVHDGPLGDVSQISSVVQHRGSIPLFWSQETSVLSPKPAIILHKNDPSYEATRLHFQNLADRYGTPVVVLNLVKTLEKKPRETILYQEFANSVAYLNQNLPKANRVKFIQWDFHMFARRKSSNVLEVLESIAVNALNLVGFYYSGKTSEDNISHICQSSHDASNGVAEENHGGCRSLNQGDTGPEVLESPCEKQSSDGEGDEDRHSGRATFQRGVLRSNCIDCLDRTNVAQYAFGLAALGRQMHALGLCSIPRVSSESGLAVTLMEMYENMGDVLAVQYGGSGAHNKVFSQRRGKWKATIQSLEFFRSIRRHYNNAYLDGEKQDAINVFLGHFRPNIEKLDLWELKSVHHLQVQRTGADDFRLSFERSQSVGNLVAQNNSSSILPNAVSKVYQNDNNSSYTIKPANGLAAGGITIGEVEMTKGFVGEEYEGYMETKLQEANDVTLNSTHSLLYKPGDARGLGDCADVDWLSSSGNSCDEDAQERHSVMAHEGENWQSSNGLLSCKTEESESYEHNDYFQDLTEALLEANTNGWKYPPEEGKEKFDYLHPSALQEEQDVGSGIIRIRAGAASLGVFSKNFVDWIHEGQTLCY